MDLLDAMALSYKGLKFQSNRMTVTAQNLAQADSTADRPGAAPYRRKVVTARLRFDRMLGADTLENGRVQLDKTPFRTRYEPGHPAANAKGEVLLPNVNPDVERADMANAVRNYEAGLSMVSASKRMVAQTLNMLRA
jgi:flagellar basal-body rod protein FlgC